MLFRWIRPLINYTNKHNKISLEMLGELRKEDKVEAHIEELSKIWSRFKQREDGDKLFKAVIYQFRWQYTVIMLYNMVQTILISFSPFIIKYLIDYVKTG